MAPVRVGGILDHSFIVVRSLIAPVILGLDFLHKHRIVLDFTIPLTIQNQVQQADHALPVEFRPILDATRNVSKKVCAVTTINEPDEDDIDT